MRQADRLIRGVRSVPYVQAWDQFSHGWGQLLYIPEPILQLCGANLGIAIDELFEQADSPAAVARLESELSALTDVSANRYFSDSPDAISTVEAALQLHLATLLVRSHERLSEDPSLQQEWLEAWQDVARTTFSHFAQQTRFMIAPDNPLETPGDVGDYGSAIRYYVGQLQATSMLPMSVLAAFPFSPVASSASLSDLLAVLTDLSTTIRLVSDIPVDLDEPLNAGIYARAVTEQISPRQAWQQLSADQTLLQRMERTICQVLRDRVSGAEPVDLACEEVCSLQDYIRSAAEARLQTYCPGV